MVSTSVQLAVQCYFALFPQSSEEDENEEGEGMDPAFREEIKMALGAAAAGSGDEVSKQSPPSHTHTHTMLPPHRVRAPLTMRRWR